MLINVNRLNSVAKGKESWKGVDWTKIKQLLRMVLSQIHAVQAYPGS